MTGRIKELNSGNAGGVIAAENGSALEFELSAVLAYDAACLAVGQTVTFDPDSRSRSKAVNVCVLRRRVPQPSERSVKIESFRYVGFEQKASIRAYRFERIMPGETTALCIVTTDLALFTKHHVRIQEGPTLCLRVLAADLEACASGNDQLECALTERDLVAHVGAGADALLRQIPRRFARAGGAKHGQFNRVAAVQAAPA